MLNFSFTDLQLAELVTKIGWVDVVAFILVLWGLIVGVKRGLEVELPTFLEVAVATVITLHYYQLVGALLQENLAVPRYPADLLSFFGIALSSIIVVKLFVKILGAVVTFKFMSGVSRIGGAILGMLRLILGFSLLSCFLLMIPLDFFTNSFSAERSLLGPFFAQTSEKFHRFTTYYIPFQLPAAGEIQGNQKDAPAVPGPKKAA